MEMELSKAQQLLNLIKADLPPVKSFKPMSENDPLGSMTDSVVAYNYNTRFLPEFNDAINHERLTVLKTVLTVLEGHFNKNDATNHERLNVLKTVLRTLEDYINKEDK